LVMSFRDYSITGRQFNFNRCLRETLLEDFSSV
jgi:hypothetical protein